MGYPPKRNYFDIFEGLSVIQVVLVIRSDYRYIMSVFG